MPILFEARSIPWLSAPQAPWGGLSSEVDRSGRPEWRIGSSWLGILQ